MQPQQSSRIDLVELKAHLVKKVGAERFKKYFFCLNRFLSQKLNKSDFDKSCFRLLGRDNLPLHNQLIRSILKNACQAKSAPPPVNGVGPTKAADQSGSLWSNGVLPLSPRKVRSCMRDRKPRDRPSPLGPTGKVDPGSHKPVPTDNGEMPLCDYQRPMQHLQAMAEPSQNVEACQEVEQAKSSSLSSSALLAPLGIPFCSASVGGSRKAQPAGPTSSFSYYDTGGLCDSDTLRKRMEQIAALQGIGGVSMECANTLNNMLDVYLKRLIKSCVEMAGQRKPHMVKQPGQGKVVNGVWPTNHPHMQTSGPRCSVSLLDFKVAMELNPQQLGEDWPLLLEKTCLQSYDWL